MSKTQTLSTLHSIFSHFCDCLLIRLSDPVSMLGWVDWSCLGPSLYAFLWLAQSLWVVNKHDHKVSIYTFLVV